MTWKGSAAARIRTESIGLIHGAQCTVLGYYGIVGINSQCMPAAAGPPGVTHATALAGKGGKGRVSIMDRDHMPESTTCHKLVCYLCCRLLLPSLLLAGAATVAGVLLKRRK